MKLTTLICGLVFTGALLAPLPGYAQQEPDKIALADNQFQDSFYEALKQKGIENYDKAIQSLQKCLALQPDNAVIYNELGKNYLGTKNYMDAEKAYLKATQLDPTNRWYWAGLYDVYYLTQDFNKSIPVVQKLTEWRKEYYQEDLVSLYMQTAQFDKALALINELDESVGKSDKREMYRLTIMSNKQYEQPQKETLEEAIRKNPKEESNYLKLIYLYSESNQEEKAQQVAKMLEKEIPDSDWAQVSLFKFHLNNNEGDKAAASMFRILESEKIDTKIKHRVLNEFLIFAANNPVYSPQLEKAVSYFKEDPNINVPKEVGKFFYNKKEYTLAAGYFSKSLENTPDDIEAIELLLYTYAGEGNYAELSKKAESYLDFYPAQASLYYLAGMGANGQKQYKKAKDWLEYGLDFIADDPELEMNFNLQLGEAYNGLGDTAKKNYYNTRAQQLRSKIN